MGDERERDPFVLDETDGDVDIFDDERADVDPFLLDATDGDIDGADDDVDETQPMTTSTQPTKTRTPPTPSPSTSLAEELVGLLIAAALAIGFMLAILYFLVRFVKWAWTND